MVPIPPLAETVARTESGPDSGVYTSIQTHEQHFNGLQHQVRTIASGWLLAALGAVAYIAGNSGADPIIDSRVLIAVLGGMCNLGLLVLWVLDQLVYHRLLDAVFLLGLRLEYRYPTLPPVRALMMAYSEGKGMSHYMHWYYLVPMFGMAVIASIASVWYFVVASSVPLAASDYTRSCAVLAAASAVFAPLWVLWKKTRLAAHAQMAAIFEDPEFVAFLENNDHALVLRKW